MRALVAVLVVGCQEPAAKQRPPLDRYLDDVRAPELLMPRAVWNRVVVPPFTVLYDDYRDRFEAAPPQLPGGTRTTRRHFAGDTELTPNQARARWLLPTMFPSEVAMVNDRPIDLVFVPDGDRWYVLAGIDRIIRARVDAKDPACGAAIDLPTASKPCRDAAWAVADATLRTDAARFQHACAIAVTACAKSSP